MPCVAGCAGSASPGVTGAVLFLNPPKSPEQSGMVVFLNPPQLPVTKWRGFQVPVTKWRGFVLEPPKSLYYYCL